LPYLYIGSHVESLACGRPIASGETVETVDAADQRLVDDGLLIPVAPDVVQVEPVVPVNTDSEEPAADAPRT